MRTTQKVHTTMCNLYAIFLLKLMCRMF